MDKSISTAVIYYSIVTTLSIAFTWMLASALDWPLMAEIPLALSIFIQLIVLSKTMFNYWCEHKNHFTEVLLARTKAILFSLDSKEEEVNI